MAKDKVLKITDRQVAHLLEEVSRVKRQIKLFKDGKTHSGTKDRLDIADEVCSGIDKVLCEL